MTHIGSIKYTYSRAKPIVTTNIQIGRNDETLDNSIWKDSFDRLLEGKRASNPINALKNIGNIDASYNRNSSLDTPKLSKLLKKNVSKGHRRRKKKPTFISSDGALISTPKGRPKSRLNKLKFNDISPIQEPTPPPLDINACYREFIGNSRTRVSLSGFYSSTLSSMCIKRKRVIALDMSNESDLRLSLAESRNMILNLSLPKNEEEPASKMSKSHNGSTLSNPILESFSSTSMLHSKENGKEQESSKLSQGYSKTENGMPNVVTEHINLGKDMNDNAEDVNGMVTNTSVSSLNGSQDTDELLTSEYHTKEDHYSTPFLGFESFEYNSQTTRSSLIDSRCKANVFINSRRRRTRQSKVYPIPETPEAIPKTHVPSINSCNTIKNETSKCERVDDSNKYEENTLDDNMACIIVDESSNSESSQECELVDKTITASAYLPSIQSPISIEIGKSNYVTLRRSTRQSKLVSVANLSAVKSPKQLMEQSHMSHNIPHVSNMGSAVIGNPIGRSKKTVHFNAVLEERQNSVDSIYSIGENSKIDVPIILRPGKWRKSLQALKRRTMSIETAKLSRCSNRITTVIIEESENEEDSIHHCKTLVTLPEIPSSHILTARDVVLRHCKQTEPILFEEAFPQSSLRHCRKIGEGTYSEVFMNKCSRNNRQVVLKIIPIEGDLEVNGETQKKFEEILSEIVITTELSNLRYNNDFKTDGFVEAMQIKCVKGKYPQKFVNQWEVWNGNGRSENDHPNIFEDDQLYIVLELANAGQDLEAFKFQNAKQSYSAFLQVSVSLAIAEKQFEFEHRDLHCGNILLSSTKDKEVMYQFAGKEITIPTHGVRATIIDFTLSRMVVNTCRHYNDLAYDDELFAATGDYQFDIYRKMKTCLQNHWERFEPCTNVFWLHYVIDKFINSVHYKNKSSEIHRESIKKLTKLHVDLLNFSSASNFIEDIYQIN